MSGSLLSVLRERAAGFLSGNLKQAAAAGLAVALISLGAVGAPTANAQPIERPRVDGVVTTEFGTSDPIGLRYSYTVVNPQTLTPTGLDPGPLPGIDGFALPFFQDIPITDITVPTGWEFFGAPGAMWDAYYNPALDPKGSYNGVPASNFVHPAGILVFQTTDHAFRVQPGQSLAGFSFLAPLDATPSDGPVLMNDVVGGVLIGDPPIPTAPQVGSGVPEPLSASMLGLAAAAGAMSLTRRRRA